MLSLRYARHTRSFIISFSTSATQSLVNSPTIINPFLLPNSLTTVPNNGSLSNTYNNSNNDVVHFFRDWFMSRNKPLLDQIFQILRLNDDSSIDSSLSRFNLFPTEGLVLDVLSYGQKDVLSCLKFFDWAGRQKGFHHTKVTFNAIFRILSKAERMTTILEFLQNYAKKRYLHNVTYHGILVVGYAVAGKCDLALQVFARMRFGGNDLDGFAYHVLLNSLVEQGGVEREDTYFDIVESLAKEIRIRGFENEVTHSILIKGLAKRERLEEGEEYLRSVLNGGDACGTAVATYVAALCKGNQFERAALLVEEIREMGVVAMEPAYGAWIKALVSAGRLDGALEFLKDKKLVEGYVPDVFRYNSLILKLLRENRFDEMFELLVEMKEMGIVADDVTMNSVLCLSCKVGRMDIAMDLYNSREELGLSVNCMAYNYLINTLLGDVSIDEAYHVLKSSMDQGYFPGRKTFLMIADALCREGKPEKMRELVLMMIERNIMPCSVTYDHLISALCNASRVDDGYWLYNLLNRLNKSCRKFSYANLVRGFCKIGRGEIAARLLVEMQEKHPLKNRAPGEERISRDYLLIRKLVREVICCICKMENPDRLFYRFLDMQLAVPNLPSSYIYNFFMDGAGHAGKPEFARQLYEMMKISGVTPDYKSDIYLLQSYLKSKNIAHALHLFDTLSSKWHRRKLWSSMIVGLCKANKPGYAASILKTMKSKGLTPSMECYEELIRLYCDMGQYHVAIDLVNDMTGIGRPISSFVGNIFLLHALKSDKIYSAWTTYLDCTQEKLTAYCWLLGELIGVFSGCIEVEGEFNIEDLEKRIQQCFHIDVFTNNILLRRASMSGVDYACEYFYRLCEKGYEPNRWTYDIIVHSLARDGRKMEARKWMDEMFRRGYDLTEATQRII